MTNGLYRYVYDGNGLRVAKKSNSNSSCSTGTVVKLYWRSLSGDALAETDANGNTINEYVFFAGRRVASRNSSGNVFYWFADQLGSTRTITDANGNLCYDAEFTPYGQEISHSERLQTTACLPNYKFTGYERDPETTVGANDTGLDYAFARYYSSRLGRFLSTDPVGGAIGNLQSHNAYAYVVNNPMNAIDPSGMTCLPSGRATGAGACPDGDYPNPGGGGPGCGLDCAAGAGFVGALGGNGSYAGTCPAQYQGCLTNGTGGYIGITGSSLYNCSTSNSCTESSGSTGVVYQYTPGGYTCFSIGTGDPTCSDPIPSHLDISTDTSDPLIGMNIFQFGTFTQADRLVKAGTAFVAVEAAPVVYIEAAPVVADAVDPGGRIFGKSTWLNQGKYWRVGWSRLGGNYTFRVAGKIVDWLAGEAGAKWDIFGGPPL